MIVKTELITLDGFYVAGIYVRTINNGKSHEDIKVLWDKFQNENVYWQIENKASDDIYSIYTNYEADYTSYYTAVLGCRVTSIVTLPEGFKSILVPEGKYYIYHLAGKCPANVLNAWDKIWQSNIERKYTADFDVYTPNLKNFEDSEVSIYVAV